MGSYRHRWVEIYVETLTVFVVVVQDGVLHVTVVVVAVAMVVVIVPMKSQGLAERSSLNQNDSRKALSILDFQETTSFRFDVLVLDVVYVVVGTDFGLVTHVEVTQPR